MIFFFYKRATQQQMEDSCFKALFLHSRNCALMAPPNNYILLFSCVFLLNNNCLLRLYSGGPKRWAGYYLKIDSTATAGNDDTDDARRRRRLLASRGQKMTPNVPLESTQQWQGEWLGPRVVINKIQNRPRVASGRWLRGLDRCPGQLWLLKVIGQFVDGKNGLSNHNVFIWGASFMLLCKHIFLIHMMMVGNLLADL